MTTPTHVEWPIGEGADAESGVCTIEEWRGGNEGLEEEYEALCRGEAVEGGGGAAPVFTVRPAAAPASGGPAEPEVKISKLSVDELRAKHLELVGRETKSTNRTYLIWRVRQAQKGRIPVGAARGRGGETVPHKVLPVRVPTEAVSALDGAWKRLGMKTRTEFFRRAIHTCLLHAGESESAACFAE